MTQDDIHGSETSIVNGINCWAPEGIAGRGILVDYDSWAAKNGIEYDRLGSHSIEIEDVQTILKESEIEVRKGDILLLRTGK